MTTISASDEFKKSSKERRYSCGFLNGSSLILPPLPPIFFANLICLGIIGLFLAHLLTPRIFGSEMGPVDSEEAPIVDESHLGGASKDLHGMGDDALQKLVTFRHELHRWDRSVRGFRYGHNFFASYASTSGFWRTNGALEKGDYVYNYEKKVDTTSDAWMFEYTFHLPIDGSFGYFLGSSAGLLINEDSPGREIVVDRALVFPGLTLGLDYNFSAAARGFVALDGQLVRYERFREHHDDPEFEREVAFFSAYSLRSEVGLDFFFRLRWGLRVVYERARIENMKVIGSEGTPLGIARYREVTRLVGGIVYHII